MSVSLYIFTFLNIWWITLFMVLPFGVKPVETPSADHYAGAPQKPHIAKKFLITTVIALVLTYGLHLLLLWAPIEVRNG